MDFRYSFLSAFLALPSIITNIYHPLNRNAIVLSPQGRRQVRENLPFVLLARLGTRNRGPEKPGGARGLR
ncbi:hypothetical protein PUN28_003349 [Cardiocondyla obscurior]|uniref:Uncharacterized protein n=1 Tax=Cardiocondyla obscurior TaxID=286306 RepID=A0AAW2GJ87_9HYME